MKIETFLLDDILYVSDFSYQYGQYEWAGAMNIRRNKISVIGSNDFICDLLRPLLPLPVKMINAKEIDTIGDYKEFMDWFRINKNIIFENRIYGENVNINNEKTKSFWNQRANKYNKEHPYMTVKLGDNKPEQSDEWDVYEKSHAISKLGIKHEDYVIDIGCGVGRFADFIIPQCKYYLGTDFAEKLITIANDRIYPLFSQDKYQFVVEHIRNIKQDNPDIPYCGSYNIVILAGILMYINDNDIQNLLNNILGMVSKKCTIYFSGPVAKELRLTLNEYYSNELKSNYSAIYRTENEYMIFFDLMFKNGFTLSEKGDYNMFSLKKSETERIYMILKKE
jgi:2-polyprenyl-3-methyl-5-hydroxy-6-metoxy-1,4-benzoquinol methylase